MGKVIVVVGGAGALGSAIIHAGNLNGAKTVSVDLRACKEASHSVIIKSSEDLKSVLDDLSKANITRVDAVYCTAGSWQGGSIGSPDALSVSRAMWQVNVEPSIMSAQLASALSSKVLLLTSAKAVLHATPDMIGYGLAKKAVVQLAASLAEDKQFGAKVVCLLPEVIDTQANRDAMPGADMSRWTKLDALADYCWTLNESDIASGSLVTVVTRENQTTFTTVN